MHDRAFCVAIGRSLLPITLGLFLSPTGCSPEPVKSENRPPATKHLKYIEELHEEGGGESVARQGPLIAGPFDQTPPRHPLTRPIQSILPEESTRHAQAAP